MTSPGPHVRGMCGGRGRHGVRGGVRGKGWSGVRGKGWSEGGVRGKG